MTLEVDPEKSRSLLSSHGLRFYRGVSRCRTHDITRAEHLKAGALQLRQVAAGNSFCRIDLFFSMLRESLNA